MTPFSLPPELPGKLNAVVDVGSILPDAEQAGGEQIVSCSTLLRCRIGDAHDDLGGTGGQFGWNLDDQAMVRWDYRLHRGALHVSYIARIALTQPHLAAQRSGCGGLLGSRRRTYLMRRGWPRSQPRTPEERATRRPRVLLAPSHASLSAPRLILKGEQQ